MINTKRYSDQHSEAYSGPYQKSRMKLLCGNIPRLLTVNYFCNAFRRRCLTDSYKYSFDIEVK